MSIGREASSSDALSVPPEARQIWAIDATVPLRRALAEGRMIINPILDLHLNSEGMRIIARAIAQRQKTP